MTDLKMGIPPVQTLLVCRLRHKKLARGQSLTAGEIELENASSGVIEIDSDRHPLQYLNLVVTDSQGVLLSEGHYGDVFSPRGRIDTVRLAPGEKYTHNVSLLGTVAEGNKTPGTYVVRAVYEHKQLKAVSEPVLVELPAPIRRA
jgi:hypothetical protein